MAGEFLSFLLVSIVGANGADKVRDLTGFACLYRFGLSRPGLGSRTSQKLHGRKIFSSSVFIDLVDLGALQVLFKGGTMGTKVRS